MNMPNNDQAKDTGLAVSLIFLLICWGTENIHYVPVAIIALILTMSVPQIFTYPARLWFGLSHFMGESVSKVLMTVVFTCIVVPVGLLRRLTGKDSMNLKKWRAGRESVFIDRNKTMTPADLEKPF